MFGMENNTAAHLSEQVGRLDRTQRNRDVKVVERVTRHTDARLAAQFIEIRDDEEGTPPFATMTPPAGGSTSIVPAESVPSVSVRASWR